MSRRMFSSDIVDSDAFLDMPQSSQLLYFHLGMRADDDGFVSPKKIMRMIGAADDDLKVLLSKRFLLPFDSGVVVIKHWLIHNMIRSDRYTETKYIEEKTTLRVKKNMAYTDNLEEEELSLPPFKEKPQWLINREAALKESSLPYSFSYKTTQAFWGKNCPICNVEMRVQEMSKKCIPTIQHNIPLSKGGKHELGNISVICHNCNVSVRDKGTEELNAKEVIEVWHTIGNQSATQVKLGKVKLGKDRIEREVAFAPPSPEEVSKYCLERKNKVDPQQFIDFYSSKGWLIGKNKMKDWRAAVRTWEARDKLESETANPIYNKLVIK